MAKYMKTEDGYQEIEIINSNKMNMNNPVGTGSFSMERKSGSTVGRYSHAEGFVATASGYCSHAEGNSTNANGSHSHAEGHYSTAGGDSSHAEGGSAKANGDSSHAEGYATAANGGSSHAEGYYTVANGMYSHSEGSYTKASGRSQHVYGEYNINEAASPYVRGKYVQIVGNGTSSKRSNAHTLDWNGVPWFQGRPQFGGTAQDDRSQTVMANGDSEIILTSTGGKKFSITVDDSGVLTATEVTS